MNRLGYDRIVGYIGRTWIGWVCWFFMAEGVYQMYNHFDHSNWVYYPLLFVAILFWMRVLAQFDRPLTNPRMIERQAQKIFLDAGRTRSQFRDWFVRPTGWLEDRTPYMALHMGHHLQVLDAAHREVSSEDPGY